MKRLTFFGFFICLSLLLFRCAGQGDNEQIQTADEKVQDNESTEGGFSDLGLSVDDVLGTDTSEWEALIGLKTVPAQYSSIEHIVSVPGQIVPDQNKIAIVSPFIESSVNCVFVNIGDYVQKSDELICLTSPQIGILRAEYDKAKAELDIQKQNYERQSKLFQENIISQKLFLEAELNNKIAEVNYSYTSNKLIAMGIREDELDNPPSGHSNAIGSTIHVHSPISGIITARNASIGQKVDQTTRLFEIINIKNVWCESDIFEKDITKVQIGQMVRIRVAAYKQEVFQGSIFYIGSTLNPDTRTIKIMIAIDNKSERLKPGMYASTSIVVGQKEDVLVLPKEAILEDENLKIVFVKEGTEYHRHVVGLGIVSDAFVEILSGLEPGDEIVTKGNYQLKSKLKMGSLDPHAGHSH